MSKYHRVSKSEPECAEAFDSANALGLPESEDPMSGPAVVATFITVAFGLLTLAWGGAHAIEVGAFAKARPRK